MKRFIFVILALVCTACCSRPQNFNVIPMPASVNLSEGSFCVKGARVSIDQDLDSSSVAAVWRFIGSLETATGRKCRAGDGGFRFTLDEGLEAEEYALDIRPDGVLVRASGLNGFVYACETIKQMLPAAVYGSVRAGANWVLPCAQIQDKPRFAWRGVLLDAGRHFWSVEETKRIIDVMTAYKLNRFHWHLTDDQGWRVEIKAYPRLTETGAWRSGTQIGRDKDSSDGIRYGGYYTQDELRDVVDYAAARGIIVIPEIDLPGHTVSALASYPELGCTGGPYEVRQRWGISQDILCAGNEETFTFIERVLTEVMDIFPSEYIHFGGDECFGDRIERQGLVPWDKCPRCAARMKELGIKPGHEARHYLQNYVSARIQKFLVDNGRKVIGWDEILQGDLAPGSTIMSWRGTKGGIEAAGKGFDVIMSPNTFMYIDYYQTREQDKEPLCYGKYLPLEKVYSYEPLDGMPDEAGHRILGVQCNLWTEFIGTPRHLEYMLLPRMCAASEVQWCAAGAKDFARFDASLDHSFEIFDAMGLDYCLACRGLIGYDRLPARDSLELAEYLSGLEK